MQKKEKFLLIAGILGILCFFLTYFTVSRTGFSISFTGLDIVQSLLAKKSGGLSPYDSMSAAAHENPAAFIIGLFLGILFISQPIMNAIFGLRYILHSQRPAERSYVFDMVLGIVLGSLNFGTLILMNIAIAAQGSAYKGIAIYPSIAFVLGIAVFIAPRIISKTMKPQLNESPAENFGAPHETGTGQ